MKKSLLFLLTIFTLIAFISCGSTPEAAPEEPKAPVEAEDVLSPEEEAALLSEINDARTRALNAFLLQIVASCSTS